VLLSAPGRSMVTVMLGQVESQLRTAMPQQADTQLANLKKAFDDFLAGQTVDPMKVAVVPPLQQLVAAVVNPSTATLARALIGFDPAKAVAQVHVPVFVVNGEKDIQVDPEKDAKALAAAAKGATLFLAPDANHVLKHETKTVAELRADLASVQMNYNADGRALDEATVQALVTWLAAH
jgi:pimeloyl-ACP methyl ester carboxylesterase